MTSRTTLQRIGDWWTGVRAKNDARREHLACATLIATHPRSKNSTERERRRLSKSIGTLNRLGKSWMVKNWYESGNPYSDGSRSTVGTYSTDARYDQNPVARRVMEIRCRYWEQNSPLMKSTLDVGSQYVIGTHMPVATSLADDANWARMAEKVFEEMNQDAGLNGESMFSLLDVGFRRKKVDGGVLFVETSKPGKVTIRRGTKYETQLDVLVPCYQIIESHRIGSTYDAWTSNNQSNIVDGVQYEEIQTKTSDGVTRKQMVKTGYWVNDAFTIQTGQQQYRFVPLANCFYATSAHRANEPRGVSDFYAGEPTLALLEDLLKLEMRAQEVQSDISLFITNGAGQLMDKKMEPILGAFGVAVSKDEAGQPVVTAKQIDEVKAIYEKIWGGKTMVGRTGDTLTPVAPNRPAEATLNLWNFLIDSWCAAANVPRILVFAKWSKGQGTEVRAEIERANAAFIKEFNIVWKPLIHRAWKYRIGWAIKNDERLKNAPANWDQIEVSPPRSVVVDLGYVSANNLAEMAAGVYPLHNWAQDHGTTKQKIIQHAVSDIFDIKRECLEQAKRSENAGITVNAGEVRQDLGKISSESSPTNDPNGGQKTPQMQEENT